MNTDVLIRDLEDIVNSMDLSLLPYQKGNSIRIKNFAIRKNSQGFMIYDCENNQMVAKTYFKSSAIAIAKNLAKQQDVVKEVQNLDKALLKHYNDAIFFKHKIKGNCNLLELESRKIRLSVSVDETYKIRHTIEELIFD